MIPKMANTILKCEIKFSNYNFIVILLIKSHSTRVNPGLLRTLIGC
jgi:hypothetical protein